MYNPIFLTSGIQLSDDPMIALRSAVYALSVRTGARRQETDG